jgi:hypothetical protein
MTTPPPRAPWTVPIADGPLAPWADRTLAAVVAIAASVVYGALVQVRPDARGHGTHEQFGWDACGWPLHYGIPCPTCGCTTAACLLVHGRIVDAFVTQPFGAALAACGLLLGVHAMLCLLRGRSFADGLVRWPFWRIVGGGFLLLLLAWGYTWLKWGGTP